LPAMSFLTMAFLAMCARAAMGGKLDGAIGDG